MDNPFLATANTPGNVVLDLDGVVFLGGEAIAGTGRVLTKLERLGWTLVFATNNATRTQETIAARIEAQTGYAAAPEQIVTSAVAAAAIISVPDQPVLVVGEQGLVDTLREAGHRLTESPTEAACVVVGLDRDFSYDKMAAATAAIRAGARFVATNTDVTFPTPTGQVPGAGAIVASIAAASGRAPEEAGKPNSPMIEAVQARLGAGSTWVVGDRPETDLAFAQAAGWRSVLVLSGVVTDPADVPAEWAPDLVIGSLPDLFDPAQ